MSVIVYSKQNCPQCELTKRDMDILGIEYSVVDIEKDTLAMDELISMGFKSAPVVKAEGSFWSGYDQEKIKSLVTYA